MNACKVLQDGPPRGYGHYSEDGQRWWDESRQRWFRTIADSDVLEVHLEDAGHTSWWRSVLTTLTGQYGTQSFRFVARARSSPSHWPAYAVASGTFPVQPLQLPLDSIDEKAAWTPEIKDRLKELDNFLVAQGWRRTGIGPHWWSHRYERPDLAWEAPQ